jgi:hypothetical protein
MTVLPLLAALIALVLFGWLMQREKAAQRGRRGRLLADCVPLFDTAALTEGGDGFPKLAGTIGERRIRIEFVPDSMTIRRLPQLWMVLTILDPLPVHTAVGALVRPSGAEFYALTPALAQRLEPPPPFPSEVLLRASGPDAPSLLLRVAEPMARLLADPKLKEIAVTPKGLRAVYQVVEGRRGQHLLLRQCDFGDDKVTPVTLIHLLDGLDAVAVALRPERTRPSREEGPAGSALRRIGKPES